MGLRKMMMLMHALLVSWQWSAVAFAGPSIISGEPWWGCQDRNELQSINKMLYQGDKKAWANSLAEGIAKGRCIMFNNGQKVFLDDTAIFSGLVKVRPEGSIKKYWTNTEAVK